MKRINDIRNELRSIADAEATKLWRLARRAQEHGCSALVVRLIRAEGTQLSRMNPEDILNPFIYWAYAFKF